MFLIGTLLISSGLAMGLLIIFSKSYRMKQVLFAYWYSSATKITMPATRLYKNELFSTLENLESKDPELKKEGKGILRLLEVGVGPCCNLEHYPDGTRLITVDPNENFLQTFNEQRAQYPNVILEKHHVGFGEDMSQIADESVDVVVITYVLCSAHDINLFLKEAYRVLVPGGRLYFMEHVAAKNRVGRWAQTLFQPIWAQFNCDCQLTVPVLKHIEESKFRLETRRFFTVSALSLMCPCVLPHVYGIALKS